MLLYAQYFSIPLLPTIFPEDKNSLLRQSNKLPLLPVCTAEQGSQLLNRMHFCPFSEDYWKIPIFKYESNAVDPPSLKHLEK